MSQGSLLETDMWIKIIPGIYGRSHTKHPPVKKKSCQYNIHSRICRSALWLTKAQVKLCAFLTIRCNSAFVLFCYSFNSCKSCAFQILILIQMVSKRHYQILDNKHVQMHALEQERDKHFWEQCKKVIHLGMKNEQAQGSIQFCPCATILLGKSWKWHFCLLLFWLATNWSDII